MYRARSPRRRRPLPCCRLRRVGLAPRLRPSGLQAGRTV